VCGESEKKRTTEEEAVAPKGRKADDQHGGEAEEDSTGLTPLTQVCDGHGDGHERSTEVGKAMA
jgi:hypothetical protein